MKKRAYFYTEESIYEEEDPYFETVGEWAFKGSYEPLVTRRLKRMDIVSETHF